MSTTRGADLSSGLRPDEDLPLMDNGGLELFNEGMYFFGVDHASTAAFWNAMHPTPHDFNLVREMVGFFLPDGRIALSKAYGRGRTPTTQGAANLFYECLDPFRRWRVRYDAMVQVVSQESTLSARVPDGPRVPAQLDVEVTAVTPVWVHGAGNGVSIDDTRDEHGYIRHYNQHWTFEGTMAVGDESFTISGNGIRDHSRGHRNYGDALGHHFVLGRTDTGRSFGLLRLETRSRGEVLAGYLVDDARLSHAEIAEITPAAIAGPGERFRVVLEHESGTSVIEGETLGSAGWMMYPPHDVLYGIDTTLPGGVPLLHSPMRFTLDGEPGIGLYERSSAALGTPA
jgi:hypothetical protein